MYRGWTQTDYQNKNHNINQKDEGTLGDRGRDGGTNFILRFKEQDTRLTLQEHKSLMQQSKRNCDENAMAASSVQRVSLYSQGSRKVSIVAV